MKIVVFGLLTTAALALVTASTADAVRVKDAKGRSVNVQPSATYGECVAKGRRLGHSEAKSRAHCDGIARFRK